MANLVNNLSEGIREIMDMKIKNEKLMDTYEVCDCFHKYTNFKNDLIEYKCLRCNKNYQRKFDEKLKE